MMAPASAKPGASPLLEARGFSLAAGERTLVESLDWQVWPGERWCLIGRNATGKSSLLRALAGLAVPRRGGELRWLGRPQHEWPPGEAACLRAWMPQQPADRFALPVQRLLELFGGGAVTYNGSTDSSYSYLKPIFYLGATFSFSAG